MHVRLMIVDDEAEIREMLSRHFRFLGFEVLTAANGREALDLLETKRTEIVITDLMMPVMDGIQLLRQLRQNHPMVRPIVMTGYVSLDNAMACMRLGAHTFVFKPLEDLTQLEHAIDEVVHGLQRWVDLLQQLRSMRPETAGAAHG